MHTTQKKHKVGVLGAGLEALHRSPRYGGKRHYQNLRDVIPFKTYILRYILIRTNQYIVVLASRGVVYYSGSTEFLPEHLYTSRIQDKIHTTRLYNTPVQHVNRKIKRKRKTRLD